jgi:transcriptional antiterminator NusG
MASPNPPSSDDKNRPSEGQPVQPAQQQPVDAEHGESNAKLRWYVVHTYSGHENKAKISLLERVKQMGLDKSFGNVLIPTESVLEMVKGQRRTTTRKFYPGYMFVQMELNEATYHLVKNTPKITGFLGGQNPTPVPERDIAQINTQMSEGAVKPKPRVSFEQNENVRVIDGPFANFSGIVEEVKPEKQKVRVLVSIFGRATPVELDFAQVEKA